MEQPNIEQRLTEVEKVTNDIIKNEQMLVRLAKRHRLGLEAVTLDIGDMREQVDQLHQKVDRMGQDVSQMNKKLDLILERLPKP